MSIGNDVGYSSHQAMFRGDPLRFILLVVLIPVFGVGALGLAVWYVVAKSVHLEIDPTGRITFTKGILSKDRVELTMRAIRSVRIRRSLFQRLFGTGDILIFTAGDLPEIVAKGMPEPHRLRKLLDKR